MRYQQRWTMFYIKYSANVNKTTNSRNWHIFCVLPPDKTFNVSTSSTYIFRNPIVQLWSALWRRLQRRTEEWWSDPFLLPQVAFSLNNIESIWLLGYHMHFQIYTKHKHEPSQSPVWTAALQWPSVRGSRLSSGTLSSSRTTGWPKLEIDPPCLGSNVFCRNLELNNWVKFFFQLNFLLQKPQTESPHLWLCCEHDQGVYELGEQKLDSPKYFSLLCEQTWEIRNFQVKFRPSNTYFMIIPFCRCASRNKNDQY